jgi:hypothetical protein
MPVMDLELCRAHPSADEADEQSSEIAVEPSRRGDVQCNQEIRD